MKRTVFAAAATLALGAAGTAFAGADFQDYARVENVSPQYEQINVPRQECYSEVVPQRSYRRSDSLAGPIIGGVAGGLLGSRFGGGNGRVATAAVGAVAGAIVGDRLQNRGGEVEYSEREVRRCRTVDHFESRLSGYHVAYEYQGRSYATFLPYDPGPRLPVRVSVEPLGR
jgi:uncharacterized protein YcfJ